MLLVVAKPSYFISCSRSVLGRLLLSSSFVLSIHLSIDNILLIFGAWF